MRKLGIVLLLMLAMQPAEADWWQAMQAYEAGDHAAAAEQFRLLLPLGNRDAIFNLGAMHANGEGVAKDLQQAWAYFTLAVQLKHPNAATMLERIDLHLTQHARVQAQSLAAALSDQVLVWPVEPLVAEEERAQEQAPVQPLKRVAPKYPLNAARDGVFGYVTVRFVVDEAGKVQTAAVLEAFPEKVFDEVALQAIRGWRYESSSQKHILSVRLDFTLAGGLNIERVEQLVTQKQIWQGALLGSPRHQLLLGNLLEVISPQSGKYFMVDPELPSPPELDFSLFKSLKRPQLMVKDFSGTALVRVDSNGVIVEQLKSRVAAQSKRTDLVGQSIANYQSHGLYYIQKSSDNMRESAFVRTAISVPASYSGRFWIEQAAINGDRQAQQSMAAFDPRWQSYLITQQDAATLAWTGAKYILENKQQQGIALLDAAISEKSTLAVELKRQLL